MSCLVKITTIAFLAGTVGTGLGGLVTFLWGTVSDRAVSRLWGLAAGVMSAIVLVDLFPQALAYGGWGYLFSGGLGGVLLLKFISAYFKAEFRAGYIQTGLLLGLGIALHNLPEGLAIGAGYIAEAQLGLGLAVVMALHNLPEGLSMAVPLRLGGWRGQKILLYTILPGLPMGLGALLGAVLGTVSRLTLAATLSLAGGGMLYLIIFELLPGAYSFNYGLEASQGLVLGFSLGLLLVILL